MASLFQDLFGNWLKFDTPTDGSTFSIAVANRVWDPVNLVWVSELQSGGGGGGGSVTQGSSPWITADIDQAFRFDGSASPILYLGIAAPGSTESSAVWKITQIDTTSGVSMKYPGGVATFANAWTNRASLSYQ